jgi:NADPH-dependent curcumin reductase CurA
LAPVISREVRLLHAATQRPQLADFELVSVELPELQAGQLLVRNLYMSVDAHMQGRLGTVGFTIPAFRVGKALEGAAVGRVVASAAAGYFPGDVVTSMYGWREYHIASPSCVRRVDARVFPLSAHLSVLGTTGFTAWVAMQLAAAQPGERVLVSAADGAVGNVLGQLAKVQSCYVVGAATSAAGSAGLVEELGFDRALDGSQAELGQELGVAFPSGIDVYFDTVGGAQLGAVLSAMRTRGRIISCGMLSAFAEPAPLKRASNRTVFASKHLTMKGFLVSDWICLAPLFQKAMTDHLIAGRLRAREIVIDGIERAPSVLQQLSRDGEPCKIIVKLD